MTDVDQRAEVLDQPPCHRCGGANSDEARYCQHCGALLAPDEPGGWYEAFGKVEDPPSGEDGTVTTEGGGLETAEPAEATSIVTAMVCELSTPPIGEQGERPGWTMLEQGSPVPEAIVDELREALRVGGGLVEDVPGAPGAATAVFGPEASDGEGPLRAVRAAAEVRERLDGRAEEGDGAPAIRVRIGVGTAEVLGQGPDAQALWRQRVIDLATRLQRMADVGEVIVAEGVYRRVGDAAEVRPVDPHMSLNGGATGPLRLIDVAPDPTTATLGTQPLVGRDAEVGRLRAAAERAMAERHPVVVRLLADPGGGKTRLLDTLLQERSTQGAAAVQISCRTRADVDPADPLAALLEALCGAGPFDEAERVRTRMETILRGRSNGARVADRLFPALGLPGEAVPEETAWALGRLLEAMAEERPMVLGLDDLDETGPWFQDLILDAAAVIASPLLLVASGSDAPSTWSDGWEGERIEHVRLGPLGAEAMRELVTGLLRDPTSPPEAVEALSRASDGDPRLAEQLVAHQIDLGTLAFVRRRWVPVAALELPPDPSARGLFEARKAVLDLEDRSLLGLVAVAGDGVPRDLLAELLPDAAAPSTHQRLQALVARRLLERSDDGVMERFAFASPVLRELSSTALPVERAGAAHERCARWWELRSADRPERHAAVVARHLAAALRSGPGAATPDGTGDAARRAASLLVGSADLSSALGDRRGALAALERAAELLDPADPSRADVLLRLGTGLALAGREAEADPFLTHAARSAREAGDRAVETRARLLRGLLRLSSHRREGVEGIWETAREAEEACLAAADQAGLATVWSARAEVHRRWGHWAAAADDEERAAEHAERAGLNREATARLRSLALALEDGPRPAARSIERCRSILERVRGRSLVEHEVAGILALMLARCGSFEEAEGHLSEARTGLEEFGARSKLGALQEREGRVRVLAEQPEAAEELLRRALDLACGSGDEGLGARAAASLAELLVDVGRDHEAEELMDQIEPPGERGDFATRVSWQIARARAQAASGRPDRARDPAREALRLAEQTDLIDLRAEASLTVAEVLRAQGRPNEALPFASRALRALDRKGATASAERARSFLASIGRPVPDDERPFRDAGPEQPSSKAATGEAEPTGETGSDQPAGPDPASDPEAEPATEPSDERSDPSPREAGGPPGPERTGTESRWWSFGRS